MKPAKRRSDLGIMPSFQSNLSELFDIDRFFNEPMLRLPTWNTQLYTQIPAANICENDTEFVVELAAPGMEKKDFVVDIDNGILEIKVEKTVEKKEEKSNYTRKEYDYSAFYRSFNLPETVIEDKINATYKNGILTIHLPKTKTAQKEKVKQIAVA